MPSDDPASLRLSVHELGRLCELTDNPLPANVRALLPTGLGEDARQLEALVAQRGLAARGIVTASQDSVRVADAVTALVGLIARPGLVIRLSTDASGQTLYATPEAAVAEQHDGHGVFIYNAMEPADLVAFIIASTGLDDRPAPPAAMTCTVTVGALAQAGEAVALGDTKGAQEALVSAGASAAAAATYIQAVAAHRRSSYAVSCLSRVDDSVDASLVAWVDCGAAGYFQIDQPDALEVYGPGSGRPTELHESALDSTATITSVSGTDLIGRVLSGLPWTPTAA